MVLELNNVAQNAEKSNALHLASTKLFQINGEPLSFYVGLSTEKNRVEQLIEKHGGLVLQKFPDGFKLQELALDEDGMPSNPGQVIILVDNNAKLTRTKNLKAKHNDCFSLAYVETCIEQGKLLNLNHFRVGNKSFSANSKEKSQAKKRFLVSEERQEVTSQHEDVAVTRRAIETTPESTKKSRQKYTHEHDLILLDFVKEMISKYPEEKPLGQKLWQRAEELKILGPYRSWQSMRERFKTHLQPYLREKFASAALWNQLPVDTEDPVSSISGEEDTFTVFHSKDLERTSQPSVFATKSEAELPSKVCETQTPPAEEAESLCIMQDTSATSLETTRRTDPTTPASSSGENIESGHRNVCRELLYDERDDETEHLKQEQLVRHVIRELSSKYLVPENQVCIALLDANGSVDLAVKILNSSTT